LIDNKLKRNNSRGIDENPKIINFNELTQNVHKNKNFIFLFLHIFMKTTWFFNTFFKILYVFNTSHVLCDTFEIDYELIDLRNAHIKLNNAFVKFNKVLKFV